MERKYLVSNFHLVEVLNYLMTCPYGEVAHLIQNLKTCEEHVEKPELKLAPKPEQSE